MILSEYITMITKSLQSMPNQAVDVASASVSIDLVNGDEFEMNYDRDDEEDQNG